MMKPRFLRLIILACITAAALGSTLMISSGGPAESRVVLQQGK
jgi:hypothetical protein